MPLGLSQTVVRPSVLLATRALSVQSRSFAPSFSPLSSLAVCRPLDLLLSPRISHFCILLSLLLQLFLLLFAYFFFFQLSFLLEGCHTFVSASPSPSPSAILRHFLRPDDNGVAGVLLVASSRLPLSVLAILFAYGQGINR